ncbi:MAG: hypothetical protein LBI87_09930 [Candidatus Accumulibacter sp.]|nr:hypothetical protein [Accumulibacter sp.]
MESLAAREKFSERLAALLSEHWPASDTLWHPAREFFGWQPPVPSDASRLANALRESFIEADKWS